MEILNRSPTIVIPYLDGCGKTKQMVGSKNLYDHSIRNGSLKRSEVLQCCQMKWNKLFVFFESARLMRMF